MGRIGEGLWKKNEKEVQNPVFFGQKPVGGTGTS